MLKRFLVVEDHEDSRNMTCELLMILGHQVQGVQDAEAALEVLKAGEFDVLLTDISLPGMSGVDLARNAVSDLPTLQIIFSSGYGAISSGNLKFKAASLPKPFNLKDLQQALADIE